MSPVEKKKAPTDSQVLSAMFEALPVGVVVFGPDARHTAVSREWCRQTGVSAKDAVGRSASEIWNTPESREAEALQRRIIQEGGSIDWQDYAHEEEGETVHYRWCMRDIRDEAGRITGAIAFTVNDTAAVAERAAREEAESQRDLLIAMLGHDLRSPLQTLSMAADLLEHEPDAAVVRDGVVQRVRRTVQRMQRLTEQLLTFARARAGKLALDRRDVDLHALCAGLVADTKWTSEVVVCLDTNGPTTGSWDRDRLEQLIQNLLDNAVRHGAAPFRIEIQGDAECCWLEVANRNRQEPGSDELASQTRFDPYSGRRSADSSQHGLGLYIARWIARAHDGELEFESGAEQTRVTVRLPRGVSS